MGGSRWPVHEEILATSGFVSAALSVDHAEDVPLDGTSPITSNEWIVARANGVTDVVPRGPSLSLRYLHQAPSGPWVTDTIAGANSAYSEASIIVRTNGETDVVTQ